MKTTTRKKTSRVYYKFIDNVLIDELQVIAVGHERCRSDKKQEGPMVKNRFIIHYIEKGSGYYQLDGKTYEIKEGNIFYIPANHVISYYPDKNDPWEYYWFEYNGQIAKKINERAGLNSKNPVCTASDKSEVLETLSAMIKSLDDKADDLVAVSHIYKFFYTIIKNQSAEKNPARKAKDEQMKKIFDYININFADSELSLLTIAKHMNMNASYLSRFFKESTGVPLSKYVIDFRMHKAAGLLKRRDLSIKSIAISVGYSDPLYFTREFRRYYKNTPTSYRKELLASEE